MTGTTSSGPTTPDTVSPEAISTNARLSFALELRRRWAVDLYPALVAERGSSSCDETSALEPWFAWIERGSQKMLWRAATDAVRHRASTTVTDQNATSQTAQEIFGSLQLDSDLELPAWYRDVDIHVQPGGVWSSPEAADVYELGAKLVMLGDNDDYLFHRLFVETVLSPEQPRRVIDLGCGFGKSTWAIKRHIPDAGVVGVDLSAPLVSKAYQQASTFELDIDWRQADGRRTGLPAGSFDQVTSTMLLHELPPFAISELIAEAERLLRPGGAMHMLDFCLTGQPVRDQAMRGHSERNNEPFMAMLFDTDVEAICRNAGLVDVSWRAFDERGAGVLPSADWPQRDEWHFPWAVLTARKESS